MTKRTHIRRAEEPRKRVLLLDSMLQDPGQPKVSGVYSYFGSGANWDLRHLRKDSEITPVALRAESRRGIDGLIVSTPYLPALYAVIAELDCPVVVLEQDVPELRARTRGLVILHTDATDIVRAAVAHFRQSGKFQTYAYIHDREHCKWSETRASAFRRACPNAAVFESSARSQASDRKALRRFLSELTLPAAILAANDTRAADILDAAREIGLAVPRQLAVIGIDNDPFVCNRTTPTLTSVQPDFITEGLSAARMLDRMMRARHPTTSRHAFVGVKRLVVRQSTMYLPPAESVIMRAKDYIAAHATEGIAPGDVAAGIGTSRALLDLRFRERGEKTVGEQLTEARLQEVRRLLTETPTPISEIPALAGFANANALRNLFRRRHAQTMSAYREQVRSARKTSAGT